MSILFVRERSTAVELRDNFPTILDISLEDFIEVGEQVLWRWNTMVRFPENVLEINPRRVSALSANKVAMRVLANDRGVRIPVTYYAPDTARSHFSQSDQPLLWRPTSHSAGENMVVVTNASQVVQNNGYWSMILPKTNEYRLYMLFGKVLGIDEKIVPDPTQLAWNHAQGGVFHVLPWSRWPSVMCHMATKIVKAAELHFAAVDVIKSDGRFYFLETNTSPSMTTVYKVDLLRKAVSWIESEVTRTNNLPEIVAPLSEMVRGYRHYIHPLHNLIEEG